MARASEAAEIEFIMALSGTWSLKLKGQCLIVLIFRYEAIKNSSVRPEWRWVLLGSTSHHAPPLSDGIESLESALHFQPA